VHPSPDTPRGGHDGYAPDQPIRGFSQTHVSGTGWGQYGNILISPQVGLAVGETEHDSPKAEENATAYEYRVRLTKYDVLSEFTPTSHAVFYQFTFPKSDDASLLIDAGHSIPRDIVPAIKGQIKDGQVNWSADGRSVSGFGAYQGGFVWEVYKIYFHAELDRAPSAVGTWKNGQIGDGIRAVKTDKAEDRVGGYARFRTNAGDVVKLKIGISFKSVEAARANLRRELPD
jgi:putative alpha-1,2-mannosidase